MGSERLKVSVGLFCASLLAAFAVGAASGAVLIGESADDQAAVAEDGTSEGRAARPHRTPARTDASERQPSASRGTAGRPEVKVHTVRKGETLWEIAARHAGAGASGTDIARQMRRIAQLNRDRLTGSGGPDELMPGEKLRLT